MTQSQWSGWIEAGLFVVALSALTIVYAYADQVEAHPTVFILYATAFAAAGMIMISGLGKNPLEIIMAPQSWIFGVSAVAIEGAFFLLLTTVTPAEASLLVRAAVPISLAIGWLVFSRPISRQTLAGAAVVIASVIPVLLIIPAHARIPAFLLTCAGAFIASVKTFASEFHPHNRAAKSVLEKIRVTGLVVLATATIGLLSAALATGIAHLTGNNAAGLIPSPADYIESATLISAITLGAPLLIAMNYLAFSASVKITTENFLATSAFNPLGALLAQQIAVSLGIITIATAFDFWLLILIPIGIVGVLIIIHSRHKEANDAQ